MKTINSEDIDVLYSLSSSRALREQILAAAMQISQGQKNQTLLILFEPILTDDRLSQEWNALTHIIKDPVLKKIHLARIRTGKTAFISQEDRSLLSIIDSALIHSAEPTPVASKGDASFNLQKVLIHHYLTDNSPTTITRLSSIAGCSYPTTAKLLKSLGTLVNRHTDRRVSLLYFPGDLFSHMRAISSQARSTLRFSTPKGMNISPEEHLERLQSIKPNHIAIGGTMAARHYDPDIDLVGNPRLDLSIHHLQGPLDLAFIKKIDPALTNISDPLQPASLAIHLVRHHDSLFRTRKQGLFWADPVETLLDLYEQKLGLQADSLLEVLQNQQGNSCQ